MSDKKNIEDFFNSSMDGFNEEPSDLVWDRLDVQLENDVPAWKKYLFRWLGVVGILLLIGFGVYRNTLLTEMESLMVQKNTLETEKISLEQELINCGALAANKENTNSKETSEQSAKLIAELQRENEAQQKRINALSKKWNNNQIVNERLIRTANVITARESQEAENNLTIERHPNEGIDKDALFLNGLQKYDSLESGNIANSLIKNPILFSSLKLNNVYSEKKNLGLHSEEVVLVKKMISPYRRRSFLRYGFSVGAFSTLTDLHVDNNFNTDYEQNFDADFNLDFRIFYNLSLTTGLGFNVQKYEVRLKDTNQSFLTDFPRTNELSFAINKIESKLFYIDLPVGLKWNFGNWSKARSSFYINPGVAWQMLLPQEFEYHGANNQKVSTNVNRYFLYFGTVFLNAGVERKLGPNSRMQLGITTEKSLIGFGLEERDFLNLGLKGTILFGR